MADDNLKSLGERIRDARDSLGLSQTAAAKATAVKHQNVWWRYETGRAKVNPEHAESMAALTGISEYELLGIRPESIPHPTKRKKSDIPVIDRKEVAKLCDDSVRISHLRAMEIISLPFNLEHAEMSFAIVVTDDLMVPRFKTGDYVVIDLAGFNKIKEESLVAAMKDDGTVVLRKYRLKRSGFELEDNKGGRIEQDGLILLGPIVRIIQDSVL